MTRDGYTSDALLAWIKERQESLQENWDFDRANKQTWTQWKAGNYAGRNAMLSSMELHLRLEWGAED